MYGCTAGCRLNLLSEPRGWSSAWTTGCFRRTSSTSMVQAPLVKAVLLLLAISAMVAPSAALNFYSPAYYGVPVDFCPSLSSKPEDCGIPAATLYCQRAGYDRASYFEGPVPANETVAMQLMMDGKPRPVWNTTGGHMEKCKATAGRNCSAFLMVYCIHDKMFVNPTVNGTALDWCATVDGKKDCGRAAADIFCVRNGFSHGAWAFNGPTTSIDPKGRGQDTVSLNSQFYLSSGDGTGMVCSSKQGSCNTFVSINCEL